MNWNVPNSMFFARAVGIVVFALVLVLLEWRQRALWRSDDSLLYAETTLAANELRARVERELNAVFHLTAALASYLEVKQGNLDAREVNALLQHTYGKTLHLRNLAIAVGSRVEFVYPLPGNEPIIGFDYRTSAEQWPTIERAIEQKRSVLAGPVALVQGGTALIYRVPIFIDNRYWGLISFVIDVPTLFRSVGDSRHVYAIRTNDTVRKPVWGDSALFNDPHTVIVDSPVPGGNWQYAMHPLTAPTLRTERLLFDLVAVTISALLGYLAYAAQRHRSVLYTVSRTDPITHLLNRRALENSLELVLERRRKTDQHCALLFIDLDRFKFINDTHGHRAGDAVLSVVAERLTKELRAADLIGRWGGDELVVLVEEGNAEVIANLIERLRLAINQPVVLGSIELRVDASIGCAIFPEDGATLETLLYIADIRMYQDKQRHYA